MNSDHGWYEMERLSRTQKLTHLILRHHRLMLPHATAKTGLEYFRLHAAPFHEHTQGEEAVTYQIHICSIAIITEWRDTADGHKSKIFGSVPRSQGQKWKGCCLRCLFDVVRPAAVIPRLPFKKSRSASAFVCYSSQLFIDKAQI